MSAFDILLIGHLIGDYLFQTNWMAMNKAKKWDALLVHSAVYTLCIALIAWIGFGGLSLLDILIILLSHIFLDRRTFIVWWVRNVMRSDPNAVGWLVIMTDQVFHIIILGLVVVF
ncbi:DUF3307 domain-containing protein [Peribacillus saganii]|uniref:DUF3307 domain-containing protein n=1 Tax=Peribacillus saganii TaxID=2303992 RepID=A0A372LPL6_9BACI|nr:DUF3307 domain-containing protein [Peribacillus saganii]RFU69542.1 DUF3307 domain-containing protein [Peribacillus saganii]